MPEHPFLFGAQYYRAPTPEPDCWEADLRRMAELGFADVKLWAQWRWSHRRPDQFQFNDLHRLMDLAHAGGLRVTVNTIFDVAPVWLYDAYPDAKQVACSGAVVEPYAVGHRQIGGHPGPCYSHPGALRERVRFLQATVQALRGHPALAMWDVWNEPEQSFQARRPSMATLVCYCAHCARSFRQWLAEKYRSIDELNRVWGRCYDTFGQAEMPRETSTLVDFVDWRLFHLDLMADEARWRIEMVKELDPERTAYLHVVPNTMAVFSAVTCVDDFAMAEPCDVFAATMNGSPDFTVQVVSAARGKQVYNVESHVNFGSIRSHQRILGLDDLRRDLLPQVGLGVRGFLFWQYRAETLGAEAPAWGLVATDGSDRPVTRAARDFWAALRPHTDALLACPPPEAAIGVWKSRRNEVFHFATDQSLDPLAQAVSAFVDALYWQSLPFRFVSEAMLEAGDLAGLKLLILPQPTYLSQAEADALDQWVRGGGVLLTEPHLAAYSATSGRHARRLPGCGLADRWGIREADTTSVQHLRLQQSAGAALAGAMTDDERKALQSAAPAGGRFVPFRFGDGGMAWGADRFACLEGDELAVWARFSDGGPAIVSQQVDEGTVIYAASNLGAGAQHDPAGLRATLAWAAMAAEIGPTMDADPDADGTVHADLLCHGGRAHYAVLVSRADRTQSVRIQSPAPARGLFSGMRLEAGPSTVQLPPGFADLFEFEG